MSRKRKAAYIVLLIVITFLIYDSRIGKYKIQEGDKVQIKVTDHYGKTAVLSDNELAKGLLREYISKKNLTNEGKCSYDNELIIYKNSRKILKAKIASDSCMGAIIKGKAYNTPKDIFFDLSNKLKKRGVFLQNVEY